MVKYPSEWFGGTPKGYIRESRTSLMLCMPSITRKGKADTQSYSFSNFSSKEECWKFVEQERIKKSHESGLTKNEIRFLDKNTIEVKLTQGKTFITDAENLDIVNVFSLHARSKKEKNGIIRWYVIAQAGKPQFPFTDLICDYEIVEYVNGNTLDLREINLKEFGLGYKVNDDNKEIKDPDTIEDNYKYYLMALDELPHNEWILGNLIYGTVFFRKGDEGKKLTMRVKDVDDKILQKTFKVDDYESVNEAKIEARKYMINVSHFYETVKNKIRIIDDKIIQVMIDENNIMITDHIFLPLFIPSPDTFKTDLTISCTYSGGNEKMYAAVHCNFLDGNKKLMTFHKFIMGASFIDHINGNPLDNRLENLRFTNPSHNNTNRVILVGKNTATGISYNKKSNYYQASIKDNGVMFFKLFTIREYGNNAEKIATKFRKNILEINFETDDDYSDINFVRKDIITIENAIKRTKEYQNLYLNNTVIFPDKYLFGYNEIDPELKSKIHKEYLKIQALRFGKLDMRIKKLRTLIDQIKKQLNEESHQLNNNEIIEV